MHIDTSKQMPDSARIASPNRRDGPTAATNGSLTSVLIAQPHYYDLVPPADSQTSEPTTGTKNSEVVLGAKRPREDSPPASFRASQLRRSALTTYEDCPRWDSAEAEQNGLTSDCATDSRLASRQSDGSGSGSAEHTRRTSVANDQNRTAWEDSRGPNLVASTTTAPTVQLKERHLPVLPCVWPGQHAVDPHRPHPETQPVRASGFPLFSRLATRTADAVSAAATESLDPPYGTPPAPPPAAEPPPLRTQPSDSVSVQLGSALPPEIAARLKKKIRIIQPISKAWEEETLQSSSGTAHTSSGSGGGGASGSGSGDVTTATVARTPLERLAASTYSARKQQQPHHAAGRREYTAGPAAKSTIGTWTSTADGSAGAGAASGETCTPTPFASGAARSLARQGSIVSGRAPQGADASQPVSRRQETSGRVNRCDAGCLSVSIATEEDGVGRTLVGRAARGGSQMGALHPPQARTVAAAPSSSSQLPTKATHNVAHQLKELQALALRPVASEPGSGKRAKLIAPVSYPSSAAAGTAASAVASAVASVLTAAAGAVPPLPQAAASAAGLQRPRPVLGPAASAATGAARALISSRRSAAAPSTSCPDVPERSLSAMLAPAAAQATTGGGGPSGPATAAPQTTETARTREVVRPSAGANMGPATAQQKQVLAVAAAIAASGLTGSPPLGGNGPACAAMRPPYTSWGCAPDGAGAGLGGGGSEPRAAGLAPAGMPMPAAPVARPVPGHVSGVCLGKVQCELTLLYHWYVANKAAYLDQAQRQLRRVEELTAAHQRECAGEGPGGSGGAPAARVESGEAARAFETALKIMRVCDSVEQKWLAPQQHPSQVAAEAAPCGDGGASASATVGGRGGAAAGREYRRGRGIHAPPPPLPSLDLSADGALSAAVEVAKDHRASAIPRDSTLPGAVPGLTTRSVPTPGGEWSHGPKAALAVAAALMGSVALSAGLEAATGCAPAGAGSGGGGDGGGAGVERDLDRHGPGDAVQSEKANVAGVVSSGPPGPGAGTTSAPVLAPCNQPASA